LAINPTSVDAITLIGQAQDLGCCSATQKDGSRCKTWVDLYVGLCLSVIIFADGTAAWAKYVNTISTPPYRAVARVEQNSHPLRPLSPCLPEVASRTVAEVEAAILD